MSPKSLSFSLLLLTWLFSLTLQQLTIPIEYTQISETSNSEASPRHHLLREEHQSQNKKISRLSHNRNFIKQKQNQAKHSHQLHNMNQDPDADHLKLQTFNLEPNTYSFSLSMKIAGLKYRMSIDSGSSDIFIKGQNSIGKPKTKYQCGQTCIKNNQRYKIGYLDGHLWTYEKQLEVEIGDHKFNQSILVAYKVDQNFKDNQGLIGLSFPKLASNPNPSFLQTLINQGIIGAYAFGVNLNFQQKSRSFITFGSFDNQFFQGSLNFIDLVSDIFYYVAAQGISVGDSGLLKLSTALFDTGNTCISIPKRYQKDILNQFKKQKEGKKNDCFFSVEEHAKMFAVLRCKVESFDLLPILTIHLNGITYPIEKQFYLQACDRRPKYSKESEKKDEGVWYCDTYIESVSQMSELFLGDGFFNRYYTYFDLEKNRVGIAKNKESITIEKIIQNKLDADAQDWENILVRLNPQESQEEILQELSKNMKKKKGEKQSSDE